MNRIYLVEDDKNLGFILKEYLEFSGFSVEWIKTGLVAINNYKKADICILDIMLPQTDGFDVASKIRHKDPHVPLLFLTAKHLKTDKLKAFKLGADDYITKPVDEEELVARIRAILKRSAIDLSHTILKIGEYAFDPMNNSLQFNDELIYLTQKETDLLVELCAHKNKILLRNKVMTSLWSEDDYFNRRSMDVFISKLRKYLNRDPKIEIKNIHGKGFILIC